MPIKRSHKFIVVGAALSLMASVGLMPSRQIENQSTINNNNKLIHTNFSEFREIIENAMIESKEGCDNKFQKKYTQLGLTSHHLPTAVSLISNFYTCLKYSQGPRDIFIVVGPDHFERGYSSASTTFLPYTTPFGDIEVEKGIVNELLDQGVGIDNDALIDHSIGVHAGFIKLFFPKAHIVPLILRIDTNEQIISNISEVLTKYKDRVTVIISVDFSHYQTYQYAQILDTESKNMISNFDFDGFALQYVDSPPSMRLVGKLIGPFEINRVDVLDVANSFDFTGKINNTTGYISALFGNNFNADAEAEAEAQVMVQEEYKEYLKDQQKD